MELKIENSLNVTGENGLVFIVDLEKNGYENAKSALPFLTPNTVIVTNDKSYIIEGVESKTAIKSDGKYNKIGIFVKERKMTYEEKCEQFREAGGGDSKTLYDELPIKFGLSSSTRHPEDHRAGIVTCDLVLWMKFLDNWVRPNSAFSQNQIEQMIAMCKNDRQIIALIEMLTK